MTIPSGVKSEELGQQVSYVSDDAFDLDLDVDKIFDKYDDVFKALVGK
ncbi:AbrB family transcriptional regulator [Streptococcus mitis]